MGVGKKLTKITHDLGDLYRLIESQGSACVERGGHHEWMLALNPYTNFMTSSW
jgi:hypothetical protein